jgi:hypothetical protein
MRKLVVMVVSVAAVLSSAGTALAKGESMDPVSGTLVISGPGLDRPIAVQGEVYWSPEFGLWGAGESEGGLTATLADLGLVTAGPEVGWYVLPPDPKTVGPAYQVQASVGPADGGTSTPAPTLATLYPYAPERPLVQVSVLPHRSTAGTGLWWSAPPELYAWLLTQGLPAAPPAVPTQVPGGPVVPDAPSVLPVILFALFGLAMLGAMAAVAGRRHAARVRG